MVMYSPAGSPSLGKRTNNCNQLLFLSNYSSIFTIMQASTSAQSQNGHYNCIEPVEAAGGHGGRWLWKSFSNSPRNNRFPINVTNNAKFSLATPSSCRSFCSTIMLTLNDRRFLEGVRLRLSNIFGTPNAISSGFRVSSTLYG